MTTVSDFDINNFLGDEILNRLKPTIRTDQSHAEVSATYRRSATNTGFIADSRAPGGTRTPNRFLRTELLFH